MLEFVPEKPSVKDPFTGWNGASETRSQIRLKFPTLEEAQNYATAHGLAARVDRPRTRKPAQKVLCRQFPARPRVSLVALTPQAGIFGFW